MSSLTGVFRDPLCLGLIGSGQELLPALRSQILVPNARQDVQPLSFECRFERCNFSLHAADIRVIRRECNPKLRQFSFQVIERLLRILQSRIIENVR